MKRGFVVLALLGVLVAGCSSSAKTNADAKSSTASAPTLHFVTQNLLHGSACAPDTDRCAAPARVELFARQLVDAKCPELVGLQETNAGIVDLLETQVAKVCDGKYTVVRDDDAGNDRETVLTTLRVLDSRRERLAGPLRTMYWVRAASDAGIVEFVTTHLASSSDDRPCDPTTCPPPCAARDTLNTCQAKQVIAHVKADAHPDAVVVVGGDLNAQPGEPTIATFTDAGYRDAQLAVGAECEKATGKNCTSGRIDDALTDMKNPASKQTERLDYLWVGGRRQCGIVQPTGLFNGEPAENGPEGLAYPSDHTGVQLTLSCSTSAKEKDAGSSEATLPTTSTIASTSPGTNDPATKAAITESFETLFNGDVTGTERKLAVLEDAERLRPVFLSTFEAQKALAEKIRVRIDSIDVIDATHANVVYTLLLDGAAVLDHLPGAAVKPDGTWLVSRRTFCDVSTQGVKEIPEPCRS